MRYTVQYSDLASQETVSKALADCKKWLGSAQFKNVCKILQADNGRTPTSLVRFGLMMQGIEGYPATVLMDTYWTRQRNLFDAE
jgi:hypothetical protein